MEKNVIEQVFGINVFNDEVMQAKLPKDVYKYISPGKKLWKAEKT